MKMRSGPKVSGRSRQVAADQGWSLRGVPLYRKFAHAFAQKACLPINHNYDTRRIVAKK